MQSLLELCGTESTKELYMIAFIFTLGVQNKLESSATSDHCFTLWNSCLWKMHFVKLKIKLIWDRLR